MATSSRTAPTITGKCPGWCSEHIGFDDGSDDWHNSARIQVHGFELYISTGTLSGEPEVFMPVIGCSEGMPLADAEQLAQALLALVKEARS